ncbi:unnamed protein product [Amoebophrya sp. A25]|nr:unnamed protein product [Amoebophrya sp. A25]|eukprot:GSA25T00016505001.1
MELSILDCSGSLPAGSILSIKAGAIHCQSAISLGRPIYIPVSTSTFFSSPDTSLSFGILQEVAERSSIGPLTREQLAASGGTEKSVVFTDPSTGKETSLKVQVALPSAGVSSSSSPSSPSSPGGVGGKKHGTAISACRYLEEHDIAGVVRNLIAAVLKERPDDPMGWIYKHFEELASKTTKVDATSGTIISGILGDTSASSAGGATTTTTKAATIASSEPESRAGGDGATTSSGPTKTGGRPMVSQKTSAALDAILGPRNDLGTKLERLGMAGSSPSNQKADVAPPTGLDELENIPESDFLRRAYVFSRTPKATFDRHVRPMFIRVEVRKGHVFWEEGASVTDDECLYVLEEGRIQVRRDNVLVNVIQKKGGFFGERALLYDMPRQARCEAVAEKNVVWQLDRDTFEDYFKNDPVVAKHFAAELFPEYSSRPVIDQQEFLELQQGRYPGLDVPPEKVQLFMLLCKSPWIFSKMETTAEMTDLLSAFSVQHVDEWMPMFYRTKTEPVYPEMNKNGKIVWFTEGEPLSNNERMYVIESGTVDVLQNGRRINVCRTGDVLGELGMVFDLPRQCTCVLQEPKAKFWALSRDDFDNLLRSNDKFSSGKYSSLFYRMYPARKLSDGSVASLGGAGGRGGAAGGGSASDDEDKPLAMGKMMSDTEVFQKERKNLRGLLKTLWVFKYLNAEDFRALAFRFELEEIHCAAKRYSMRMEDGGRKFCLLREGEGADVNDFMYVIESGVIDVEQDGRPLRTLGPGDLFGELALIYGLPRQASCFAVSPSVKLWRLSRDAFQELIGCSEEITSGKWASEYYKIYGERKIEDLHLEEERTHIAQMLKHHNWCFRYLSVDDLATLVRKMEREELSKDPSDSEKNVILTEGAALGTDSGLYLIESGQFECFQSDRLVNTLKRGDVFGELGMVYGLTRQASVILASDTAVLWKVSYDLFEKYMSMNNEITSRPEYYRSYVQPDAPTLLEEEEPMMMGKTVSEKVSTLRLGLMLERIWVFQHLSDSERRNLLTRFERVRKNKNAVSKLRLLQEGDEANDDGDNHMYLVESGEVEVRKGDRCVARLTEGDIFGELALIYDTPRQASCNLTSESAVLWRLHREDFDEVIRNNEKLTTSSEFSKLFYRTYTDEGDASKATASEKNQADDPSVVADRVRSELSTVLTDPSHVTATLIDAAVAALPSSKKLRLTAKGTSVPISVMKQKSGSGGNKNGVGAIIYYIESGAAMFFEKNQPVSSKSAGEVFLSELLDRSFIDYLDLDDLTAESSREDTVLWQIPVGNVDGLATAAASAPSTHSGTASTSEEDSNYKLLREASQAALNEIYSNIK